MEPLDLDALLKKNPHLDKSAARERHRKAAKNAHKKGAATPAPSSPYRQPPKHPDDDEWNTTFPGYRPHYRGL